MASDFDYDDDLCSILVPVDALNTPGVIQSVTSNGVTLAEDSNAAWSPTATYTADQVVYKGTRLYSATGKEGNTNKDPSVITNQFVAAGPNNFWVDIGPTNRSAMFDALNSTQTSAPSPLVFVLRPGAFNGFALLNIDADSYSVTVKDSPGGAVIYSEPLTPLEGSMPGDYYEYFFDRFKPLTQFIRSGIDPYGTSEITVSLNKSTGPVKLGMFAIGDMKPVGTPQRDAVVNPGSFNYVKQDAFGNLTVKRRPSATGMSISCITETFNANTIKADIDFVSGIPCVVIGSEAPMYEWMTTVGLVRATLSPVPFPYTTVKLDITGTI